MKISRLFSKYSTLCSQRYETEQPCISVWLWLRSLETNINYNVGVVLAAGSNHCKFPSKFNVLLLPSGTKQRVNTVNKVVFCCCFF